jgi:small ligand-binding sensory domain FIST
VEIRSVDTPSVNARSIGELVAPDPQAQSSSPTFLFVRSEGFEPDELWRARKETSNPLVFGAGTHGSPGILHLQDGDVRAASAAALRVRGLVPVVRVAYSCRLLSPLLPITRTEGSMVLELDGRPALSILESLGKDLEGRPLLFTVLARHPGEWDGPAQEMLVRGIQGVDPERGGLVVGKELPDERYMTFGIHDAGAARDSFQALCRQLDRELAGAAPRFGVFLTYSGRGRIPHHAGGADTRALRERFPKLPFAGLHSAFEIAPHAGKPALQLYTGVLVVFSSPS